MALTSGTKLGPYEIQSPLGAGGMGEVYRACDTRLDRTVAIKILPGHLSDNPEAKQRFDREARAISSVNHPNICALYDVGHQDGTDFLVMEFLEGETLGDRLRKGPLPLQQVLKYGIEIGQGLEKAHSTGVVHRDLKPGNIMLTKSGAKLMDFGLAKSTPASIASPSSGGIAMTQSTPAQVPPLTVQGTIVGTFQYMSPEQIEGKESDSRSDIFAFGAVLYEMVTGKRAFEGKSQLSVASAILEREPSPISVARPDIPTALERTITICLAKDPERRWSTAHDVVLQLSLIGTLEPALVKPAPSRLRNPATCALALLVLLVGAAVGALVTHWIRPAAGTHSAIRFSVVLPKEAPLMLPNPTSQLAITPDGSTIAYVAEFHPVQSGAGSSDTAPPIDISSRGSAGVTSGLNTVLYVRRMDQPVPQRVSGSEDALNPFFSPDGLWLGWFADGMMKKVMLAGGSPITICNVTSSYMGGAFWAPDGFIYFTPADLMRVRPSGGQPEILARVDSTKDANYQSPQLLPNGNAVLLTRRPLNITNYNDAAIFAYRLDTHESIPLVEGGSAAMYVQSGHLLYARGGSIYAVPFDASKLNVLGPPVEVLQGGMLNQNSGNVAMAVSENGVLVYAPGGPIPSTTREIVEISHAGAVQVVSPNLSYVAEPAVSPDGHNLAVTIRAANDDIWLFNPVRGALTRFTFAGGDNQVPIWSGDGSHVIYSRSNRSRNLYWRSVNGSSEERLTSDDTVQFPDATTPDGKMLAFTQWTGANADIYLLPLEGAHTPRPLIATRFSEQEARFSPNGKWLAFVSDESGRNEVYVQAFGREGISSVVSTTGGMQPIWDRDGKRLYYSSGDVLMQVSFDFVSGSIGQASVALHLPPRTAIFGVSPAGNFVGLRSVSETRTASELEIATEWFGELRSRVRGGH